MKDSNVLEELDKAISAEDWDTTYDLRDDAILYILDKLYGDDTEALDSQLWCLHRLQAILYDRRM